MIASRSASGVIISHKGLNLHSKVCHCLFLSDGYRASWLCSSTLQADQARGRVEASFQGCFCVSGSFWLRDKVLVPSIVPEEHRCVAATASAFQVRLYAKEELMTSGYGRRRLSGTEHCFIFITQEITKFRRL